MQQTARIDISNLLRIADTEDGGTKIREYVERLSREELQSIVRDISVIYRNSPHDRNYNSLTLLVDEVRAESLKRLKSYNVAEDKFISQSNDNLEDILQFCAYWRQIDEPKMKRSVISQVINNIGDTERRTSVQRFKHFTKDSFVLFCNLMRHVNLFKAFHRYYVLVKFLDLFDQMTEQDIADVCQTIFHHSLQVSSDHPLTLSIKTKLLDFMEENITTIQSKSLSRICVALNPSLEYQLPREIIPRIIKFQKLIFEEEHHHRFEVRELLNISNLTNNSLITTRAGVNKDFMDVLVERILQDPSSVETLSSKDIASISCSVSKHRDTPRARLAMWRLVPRLRRLLADLPGANYKNVIFSALQFSHMGLYDHSLLADLFSCSQVMMMLMLVMMMMMMVMMMMMMMIIMIIPCLKFNSSG